MLAYLDSSALAKLVIPEAESPALHLELRDWPERVTSIVGHVEFHRAARRAHLDEIETSRVADVLRRSATIGLGPEIVHRAVTEVSATLRSLDAIHLASALSLGADLGAFIAYDRRLLDAAANLGLPVLSPA